MDEKLKLKCCPSIDKSHMDLFTKALPTGIKKLLCIHVIKFQQVDKQEYHDERKCAKE